MTASFKRSMKSIWGMVFAVIIVASIATLEPLLLPVVTQWTPTKMHREGDTVLINGYMNKTRDCEFIAVSATGTVLGQRDIVNVPLRFLDRPDGYTNVTRPVGTQDWGPWQIRLVSEVPITRVDFRVTHSCHAVWNTITHLGSLSVMVEE
jgi:hypothetical protein